MYVAFICSSDLGPRCSRVRFSKGPYDQYQDGHPPKEGQGPPPKLPESLRSGSPLICDLTRYNVFHLERMLGSEYVPSINRLKRRLGMQVPPKPKLPYLSSQ